jgi:ribose transport system ATP-binding protein
MTEAAVTIRIKGVAKSFGQTQALRGCNLSARAGEVHAIVGENGSGKSTLAKIISGIFRADRGEIDVLGAAPASPKQMREIGVATIFQEVLVADEASVLDNIYVGRDGLFRQGESREVRSAEACELLRRLVGNDIDVDAPVGSFPLSIKQWIVIARGILCRPRILVLDESSAALDLDSTVRLHGEIARLKQQGTTILIVTHRIAELVKIADAATVLRDGETVGTLGKGEINEANLLAMMTGPERAPAARTAASGRTGAKPQKVMLSASRVRISPTSLPFDFALHAGEVVGVTGLDGQGQDAFLRALAGIEQVADGAIEGRDGDVVCRIASLRNAEDFGIAYVSGDRRREGIFPDQSIYENLVVGIYSRRLGPLGVIRKDGLDEIFRREVDRLRIRINRSTNKITSLSGGNQQKVLIGRAFARLPRVIVLNDPARGVDIGTKRDLYDELRRFTDGGGAVVYLSSEIEEFFDFADRVDVFVNQTIFGSLSGNRIAEHDILGAMFGQADTDCVSFVAAEDA